tara:strand:+ start:630 stop:821 length:192 start_codon:yes stop_codon:yes gene_type:complete
MMSKEMVDALSAQDMVKAGEVFKDAMVQKVGDTLEKKRIELAKGLVSSPIESIPEVGAETDEV